MFCHTSFASRTCVTISDQRELSVRSLQVSAKSSLQMLMDQHHLLMLDSDDTRMLDSMLQLR